MAYTFSVLDKQGHCPVQDPKMAAYMYIARMQAQGRRTSTTYHPDGSVEVAADGLITLTFTKWEEPT